jgi:uncharacterized protein CbrC (UPF0167 family)
MTSDPLPIFRYHPDPTSTGSVQPSTNECAACGVARAFVYTGPVYAADELVDELCPWCIADGTAAEAFDAAFTDVGFGVPDAVPDAVRTEVSQRTPGFAGWQQEHWLYHCDDAGAYLGRVGYAELVAHADALEMVLHEHDPYGWTAEQSQAYVRGLDADGDATAYLFRCLHCDAHLAYSDMA